MPSPRHDAVVQLFRDRPQLAVEILRDMLGQDLPNTPFVRLESSSFNTRNSDDIEAEGEAEGKAEDVIRILVARGFAVSAELKAEIVSIADVAMLDTLIERAVVCDSPASLLL